MGALQMLIDAKANLKTPDNEGFTPAFIAAQEGHVNVLELLRSAQINLDAPIVVRSL